MTGSRSAVRVCRCGHADEAHTHFRRGSDCGTCGCARFGRVPRLLPARGPHPEPAVSSAAAAPVRLRVVS